MLLFYKDEPDATRVEQSSKEMEDIQRSAIDPLSQYGSHAFIPYLNPSPRSACPSPTPNTFTHIPDQEPLTILAASSWTYCGPLLLPNPTTLPPSFHTWSTLTLSHSSILLQRLLPLLSWLQTFLTHSGVQHYWLTIRCTNPTTEYDTPRWHIDDNFFTFDAAEPGLGFSSTSKERCWKLCTTLLGLPTLFLRENGKALGVLRDTKSRERERVEGHACTSIRCLGCSTYADSVREALAESLSSEETEAPAVGEVAFFRLGDEEGAVHSEPKCDTDRIFINVVPGTEQELRALTGRWGIGFPRAWCFGMPVGFVGSDEAESFGWASEN
jgi:hypothetical protein